MSDDVEANPPVTAVRIMGASLHGLDVIDRGRTVRLTGTCRRAGTNGPEPADQTLTLRWLDAEGKELLVSDTEPRRRFEDGAYRWTGYVADVPLADLPVGLLRLEVELITPETPDEPVRGVVNAAAGVLATSRPTAAGGRRFQALPAPGSDRVEILAQPAPSVPGRLRWVATLTIRAAKDIVRRRPYAWVQPVRFLTRPLYARRPIWLIGERSDTARDNGYHLFAHLRRERPDVRAYYVIERTSAQFAELSRLGRVVAHSSWKHRFLMVHAAVLANAYSIKHMLPRQWNHEFYMRQLAWRTRAYRVYLKHGINLNSKDLRRRTGGYDLYLTASRAESASAQETSGYGRQVVETGLPRFDALVPTPPSRTVLFMPTWRLYLVAKLFGDGATGEVPFEGSVYQRFVEGFLTSPRLHALLEEHDYDLQFMPHYNLRKHLTGLSVGSDRITVLDGAAANIQDVMRGCDLFVTDHSSVHFDLAYLGTPMVYTHFDAAEYAAGHAQSSWFDHERDGFGPVTHDLDSTIDAVERYLASGCEREDLYDRRAAEAFTFHDRDNSRRAVAAIEDLLRTRGIS